MMTLPELLQLSFEEKLTQYQEQLKMPLLSNIEKRALEQGATVAVTVYVTKIARKALDNSVLDLNN